MISADKILVIRLSSIGDIILTTPLLRSLKTAYPSSHVTYIIKKQYTELLSSCPYIDELIPFNSKGGFKELKNLKKLLINKNFDICLDIHKNWRSRYLRLGLGTKKTSTYHKYIFKRTLLIWFKINLYNNFKPVYERYFDSVKKLNITYDGFGTEISYPDEKKEKLQSLLLKSDYKFDSPLIIICPSATYFNKRWKPEGFIETGRYLSENKFAFLVILGGIEDVTLCKEIKLGIGERCVSFAGLLSLSESAALLKFASLVIANDSGLLHLAQSQKVPVIGIYGPTTRQLGYFPVEYKSTVIETELYCRPCTHNGLNKCPQKHFRCMNEITADRVIKAALQFIH